VNRFLKATAVKLMTYIAYVIQLLWISIKYEYTTMCCDCTCDWLFSSSYM